MAGQNLGSGFGDVREAGGERFCEGPVDRFPFGRNDREDGGLLEKRVGELPGFIDRIGFPDEQSSFFGSPEKAGDGLGGRRGDGQEKVQGDHPADEGRPLEKGAVLRIEGQTRRQEFGEGLRQGGPSREASPLLRALQIAPAHDLEKERNASRRPDNILFLFRSDRPVLQKKADQGTALLGAEGTDGAFSNPFEPFEPGRGLPAPDGQNGRDPSRNRRILQDLPEDLPGRVVGPVEVLDQQKKAVPAPSPENGDEDRLESLPPVKADRSENGGVIRGKAQKIGQKDRRFSGGGEANGENIFPDLFPGKLRILPDRKADQISHEADDRIKGAVAELGKAFQSPDLDRKGVRSGASPRQGAGDERPDQPALSDSGRTLKKENPPFVRLPPGGKKLELGVSSHGKRLLQNLFERGAVGDPPKAEGPADPGREPEAIGRVEAELAGEKGDGGFRDQEIPGLGLHAKRHGDPLHASRRFVKQFSPGHHRSRVEPRPDGDAGLPPEELGQLQGSACGPAGGPLPGRAQAEPGESGAPVGGDRDAAPPGNELRNLL